MNTINDEFEHWKQWQRYMIKKRFKIPATKVMKFGRWWKIKEWIYFRFFARFKRDDILKVFGLTKKDMKNLKKFCKKYDRRK